MTPEQFAYWLQGFSEVSSERPTKEQWEIIRNHLALVFTKYTPAYPTDPQIFRDGWHIPEVIC